MLKRIHILLFVAVLAIAIPVCAGLGGPYHSYDWGKSYGMGDADFVLYEDYIAIYVDSYSYLDDDYVWNVAIIYTNPERFRDKNEFIDNFESIIPGIIAYGALDGRKVTIIKAAAFIDGINYYGHWGEVLQGATFKSASPDDGEYIQVYSK